MDFEKWWREESGWFTGGEDDKDLWCAEKDLAYSAWVKAMEMMDGEIDELREQLTEAEGEIEDLNHEIENLVDQNSSLESEMLKLETDCYELQAELEGVNE